MKRILFSLLFLGWYNMIYTQPATFSKVFSNFLLNPENGWVIIEASGGYILLSAVNCLDNSDYTCCMISKIDPLGNIVWSNIYPFRPGVSNMVIKDDRIYASGHTNGIGSQFSLYCLDSLGNVVWNKEYGDTLVEDEFPRLLLWGDKWLLCGAQDRNINNRPAPIMYFVITDIDGHQIDEFYYGAGNESTLVNKLISDNQGHCIASFVYCPDACFLDLKAGVVSVNQAGDIIWELDLPYSYNPWSCVLSQMDNNTLAIKWYVDNTDIPNHDLTPPAIFFTDMLGTILDTIVFQNQTLKEVRNMEPVWGKGLVGSGFEYIDYINQSNAPLAGWLFRMDENREILWERTYLDSSYQGRSFGLQHIIPTSDGGYIATGTITNYMTGVWESHNWVLKLDAMGCLVPGCSNINYITDTEDAVFLKGKDIKVYPNPATAGYINLVFDPVDVFRQGMEAFLFTNDGQMTQRYILTNASIRLDLTLIPVGVYFLVIREQNEIIGIKKIIVGL